MITNINIIDVMKQYVSMDRLIRYIIKKCIGIMVILFFLVIEQIRRIFYRV